MPTRRGSTTIRLRNMPLIGWPPVVPGYVIPFGKKSYIVTRTCAGDRVATGREHGGVRDVALVNVHWSPWFSQYVLPSTRCRRRTRQPRSPDALRPRGVGAVDDDAAVDAHRVHEVVERAAGVGLCEAVAVSKHRLFLEVLPAGRFGSGRSLEAVQGSSDPNRPRRS